MSAKKFKKAIVLQIILSIILVFFSLLYETRDNEGAKGVDFPEYHYQLQWGWPFPYIQDSVANSESEFNRISLLYDNPMPLNFLADIAIFYLLISGAIYSYQKFKQID